jgi:PAS domain S-box-containing protein
LQKEQRSKLVSLEGVVSLVPQQSTYRVAHTNINWRNNDSIPAQLTVAIDISSETKQILDYKKLHDLKHNLMEMAPSGMAIVDLKLKTFISVNISLCKILGFEEKELILKNMFDLFVPARRAKIIEECSFDGISESGVLKKEIAICESSIGCLKKDGKTIQTEFYFFVGKEMFEQGYGLLYLKDMSQFEKKEEQVKMYAIAAETAGECMTGLDENGRINFVSAEFANLMQVEEEEVLGTIPEYLLLGELPQEIFENLWISMRRGNRWEGKISTRKNNGELIFIKLIVIPKRDNDGQLLGHICLHKDLTHVTNLENNLKTALKRAENASKSKSEFLASMSHEIRTPLNAILGMSQLLMETKLDEEQMHYAKIFQGAGNSLLAVINDILDFSKVEAGQLDLESIEFDMQDILDSVVSIMRQLIVDKNIELITDFDINRGHVLKGDPNRISQILINLVGNAIKFTLKGSVTIKIWPDDVGSNYYIYRFSVKDTGIGIPKDKHQAVFEVFTQADSSTTRKFGGTGLGLSISKKLVELMKGRIWVESEVGMGSNFNFSLRFEKGNPANLQHKHELKLKNILRFERARENQGQNSEGQDKAADENKTQGDIVLGEKPKAANDNIRILLVEDSIDNRILVKSYLKKMNVEIVEAEDGEKGVEAYCRGVFDLVLMDIQMPEMDGYHATANIRKWEKDNNRAPTHIIALTAYALKEDLKKSLDSGCNEHLTKPIKKEILIETIRNVTEKLAS